MNNHPKARAITMIKREAAIAELAALAAEWRQAAGNMPLDMVKANVGLMLADFGAILEMAPAEIDNLLEIKTEAKQ